MKFLFYCFGFPAVGLITNFCKLVKLKFNFSMFVNLSLKSGSKNLNKAERYANIGYGTVNTRRWANAVGTLNSGDFDFSNGT